MNEQNKLSYVDFKKWTLENHRRLKRFRELWKIGFNKYLKEIPRMYGDVDKTDSE